MYKSNSRLLDIFIVVIVSSLIGMLAGAGYIYTLNKGKEKSSSNVSLIDDMYNTIIDKYYGNIDEDELVEAAISGMLSKLDSNSAYMDPLTTYSFNKKMQGEYYGIGIESLTVDKGVLVVEVLKNSVANNAGIKENDVITTINGESLAGKTASYFTDLVAKSSTELKLTINRNSKSININLIPEKIIIESVSTNKFNINGKRVGYIKIDIFAANTASQFTSKLKSLEETGIDSLIIDVRNNSGGYLSQASTILELFMEKDTILYRTESKTSSLTRKDQTEENRTYPIAILVNGSTASASEVLTACFMENVGAKVIGTRTYGKGTVQETINVLDNSKAKLTTKNWYTPKGNSVNEKGIIPSVVVEPSNTYQSNPTYDNDNELERALKELSI